MKHFLFGLLIAFSVLSPSLGYAHEVLPEVYLEFVRGNPNYSDEEFDLFLSENPELQTDKDFLGHVVATRREPASWLHNARDFVRLGIIHILEGD